MMTASPADCSKRTTTQSSPTCHGEKPPLAVKRPSRPPAILLEVVKMLEELLASSPQKS